MRTVSWKIFCLALFLSIAWFFLIDLFTIKTNHVSGNGNLGLPFYPLACFFLFAVMYFLFVIYINKLGSSSYLLHAITVLLTGACIYLSLTFAIKKYELRIAELERTMAVSKTFIQDYGWLDIHLNNLYFNVYTYIAAVSLALLLTGIYCIVRRKLQ